ncbi:DUF971 domain-containing protein [bacterium]|nr:DUF971 domain-containing protein [bacterium]
MAGLDKKIPTPTEIKLHQKSRMLEVSFEDGSRFELPCEYLRVYSPSAEVRGHGPGQETLQTGKRNVEITGIEAVGNYAIQPTFSDGHNSGIYSWDTLYDLGNRQEELWGQYLARLEAEGKNRDVDESQRSAKGAGGGCGGGGGSCSH